MNSKILDLTKNMPRLSSIDKEEFKKMLKRRLPQYIAAISACMGGLTLGSGIGWSAPCVEMLKKEYDYDGLSTDLIAAAFPLGATLGMIVVPFLIDNVGRRIMMLVLVPPLLLGWLFIICGMTILGIMIVGRLITGACSGICCVTAPMYTAEICEKQIRGTLGVLFQLLIVIGILYAYCCGYSDSPIWTSVLCSITPIIFGCAMLFMPESPLYHLANGREDLARKSMVFLRGPDGDIEAEMATFKEQVEHSKRQNANLQSFLKKPVLKTMGLAYAMMLSQQLSGINAIIFYGETIFIQTGVEMDSLLQMVIFAVVQVFACIISALLIDKLGRKFLMILSTSVMGVCMVALGIFFFLKSHDSDMVNSLFWLPLTAVCIYIVAFSLGAGPIPWSYMGEIFPAKLKGAASSSAACFNWLLAFLVTVSFSTAAEALGTSTIFFFFSLICILSSIFFVFFMIETKGKTFAEILQEFGTFEIDA